MPSMSVILRPVDERNIEIIETFLGAQGLCVGSPTTAQCVRFALDLAAHTIGSHYAERERVTTAEQSDGTGLPAGNDSTPPSAHAISSGGDTTE